MTALDAAATVANMIVGLAWAGIFAACAIALLLAVRAAIRARFTVKDLKHSPEDR